MADELALAGAHLPDEQLGAAAHRPLGEGARRRPQGGIEGLPSHGDLGRLCLPGGLGGVVPLVHDLVIEHGGALQGVHTQLLGELLLQPLVHLGGPGVLPGRPQALHEEGGHGLVKGVLPQILGGQAGSLLRVAGLQGGLGLLGQPAQILLMELLPGAVQPLVEGEGVLDGEALEEGASVGGEIPLLGEAVVVAVHLPGAVHHHQGLLGGEEKVAPQGLFQRI